MARLIKYKGPDSLPGVRRPSVVADTAVGAATERFGHQIQRSAKQVAALGELLRKRRQEVDETEIERAQARVGARIRQREMEERRALQPGAIGYTDAMLKHTAEEQQKVIEAQPERLSSKLVQVFEQQRSANLARFAVGEYYEGQRYFREATDEILQAQVDLVVENSTAFETSLAKLEDVLANTPLPNEEKEALIRFGTNRLLEAWFNTLGPGERLDELARLSGEKDTSVNDLEQEVPGNVLEKRKFLKALPLPTRNRLQKEARTELTLAELAESENLTEQIAQEGTGLDPELIYQNPLLEHERKTQLLQMLESRHQQEEESIAALDWSQDPEPGNQLSPVDRQNADSVFVQLGEAGAEPHQAARMLFRNKRVLPVSYKAVLEKELRGADPGLLQAAYENLQELSQVDLVSFRVGLPGHSLQDSLYKWRLLTQRRGLSAAEAAEQLAKSNEPEIRKELEGRLAATTKTTGSGRVDAQSLLERLAAAEAIGEGFR